MLMIENNIDELLLSSCLFRIHGAVKIYWTSYKYDDAPDNWWPGIMTLYYELEVGGRLLTFQELFDRYVEPGAKVCDNPHISFKKMA